MSVQQIVAANHYMVLATADEEGLPWATPVWFATEDDREFFWVSDPNAQHSRNIAVQPQIAIAIFDSSVTPGEGTAVYMRARAEQVEPGEIGVFIRVSAQQGLQTWSEAQVTEPAKHRLYRATATEHWTLNEHDERVPERI